MTKRSKKMIYLKKDSIEYEIWHSLAMIGEMYYDTKGWENLSREETKYLFYGLDMALDEPLLEALYNWLEKKKGCKK